LRLEATIGAEERQLAKEVRLELAKMTGATVLID
jgi:hypothetical protein